MVFEPTVLGLEVLNFILVKNYVEIRFGTLSGFRLVLSLPILNVLLKFSDSQIS